MRKILKYSFITFISIILLFSLVLVLIINFVDPNQYKPIIEKTISKVTSRDFHIKGKLNWVIYPNLGIKIDQVYLSSPKEFNDLNLMEFDSAEISVGLLALLQKNVVFKQFNVNGLKLHLIKKNNENNWTFSSNVNDIKDHDEKEEKKDFKFTLNNFSFNNLHIIYDDYDKNKHYQFKNVKIVLDSDFNGGIKFDNDDQSVNIKNVNFNYNDSLLAHVNFTLKDFSDYRYDGHFDIKKFTLNKIANQYGFSQLNQPIFNDTKLNLKFTGNKNNINIKDLQLNLSEIIKLNSRINITDIKNINNIKYIGNMSVDAFNLVTLLNSMKIKQRDSLLFKKISLPETSFVGNNNNIKFEKVLLNISDYVKINFRNLIITNFSDPNIISDVSIPKFNLHKLILAVGMKESIINNINWLNEVLLDSNITANKNSLNLNSFKLKVSNTNILGNINIGSFKPFNITQNLLIDSLDLSNIIDVNGFKVTNKNIKLNGRATLLNNISSLTAQEYVAVDNIKVYGLSIDELIEEFDKNILKSFNNDLGKIINSSPMIIRKINLFRDKLTKLTKSGLKDYSKISDLGNLKVNINMVNGVVNKSNFILTGPVIVSNGNGNINLVKKNIDYQVHSKIIKKGINPELQKFIISSTINGTLKDPHTNLDWLLLQNQIIKMGIRNGSEEIKKIIINKSLDHNTKKAIDDVGKSINNAIGDLFGGKNK